MKKNLLTLESRLNRFGVRMLCASNSECALASYRMAVDEAGHSKTAQLFYESGPGDWIELVADLLAKAMQRGELPGSDPHLSARQFLALVMAETGSRLYQVAPPPLAPRHIRAMVRCFSLAPKREMLHSNQASDSRPLPKSHERFNSDADQAAESLMTAGRGTPLVARPAAIRLCSPGQGPPPSLARAERVHR